MSAKMDISLPSAWSDLSDKQMLHFFLLLQKDLSKDEVRTLMFLYLAGIKVIGSVKPVVADSQQGKPSFLLRYRKNVFRVSALSFAEALSAIDFLLEVPQFPVRLSAFRGRRAVDAALHDVSFSDYLVIENLYQGYISTQDESLLSQLADILYPKKSFWGRLFHLFSFLGTEKRKAFLVSVFYWVMSLKAHFAAEFPDLFQPASTAQSGGNLLAQGAPVASQLRSAVDAQIRALSKGDITKENEILSLDAWRALTELNAQAREYQELNSKIKS